MAAAPATTSGSHANELCTADTAPAASRNPDFDVWDTYECPAGAVLFFTEALTHSTSPWTNEENGRICLFTLYNSLNSKWGIWEPPPGLVESMPPQRQTLFRGIHCGANVPGYNYWGENHGERRPAGGPRRSIRGKEERRTVLPARCAS